MSDQDQFEFDARENLFASQLPSIAIAVLAIGLIVAVNVRWHAPTVRPAPAHEVETPTTRIADAAGSALAPAIGRRG